MSFQCAINSVDKHGFTIPPYPGVVEAGCDAAVDGFFSSFYDELAKYLTCYKYTKKQTECSIVNLKLQHFHVFNTLSALGAELYNNRTLDKNYEDKLRAIIKENNRITFEVLPMCEKYKLSEEFFGKDFKA